MNFHQKPNTFVTTVELSVRYFTNMKAFYTEVLGLKVLEESATSVSLTADGRQPLLTLVEQPDFLPRPKHAAGMYHFALLLPQRSDLANFVTHLQKIGYPFGASDHGVSEALYLSDLEGNEIEIYVDRAPEVWSWQSELVEMTIDPLNFSALAEQQTATGWQGMPLGTIMGHLHLYVSELTKTKDFYTKGLGFEIVSRYANQALFLSTGHYHHHIAINTWMGVGAPKAQANQLGMAFATIQYPDQEALAQVKQQLTQLGVTLTEKDGIIFTSDPSGNQLHLTTNK